MTIDIDDAISALLAYRQADMEGVEVLASRQAIHEVADELRRMRTPAQPIPGRGNPEWFCHWLKGYLGAITGRDELDAFEANSIRNTLNEVIGAQPPAAPVEKSGVMQAAEKAAHVVEGWSASKREYADRVTGSHNGCSAATGDASNIVPPYKFPLRVSGDSIVDDTGGYVASLSSPHGADARGEMVCFLVNAANASAFDRRATQPQSSGVTLDELSEFIDTCWANDDCTGLARHILGTYSVSRPHGASQLSLQTKGGA